MSRNRIVLLVACTVVALSDLDARAQQKALAEFDIPVLGVSATVEPSSPVVPKNIATAVRLVVRFGTQDLPVEESRQLLGEGIEARGELSGPGLNKTITLRVTEEGADPLLLPIPPLAVAGDYSITNLRIVADGLPVLDVAPRNVTLKVIDQILVTSVTTKVLTLDEIRQKGIVLDSDDYLGFEFTIGLAQESSTVNFSLPVVFDRKGVAVPQPIVPPSAPPRASVSVPAAPFPTFVPLLLEAPVDITDPDGEKIPLMMSGAPVRIPAVLVIPGNTGYLKQFFSAQLFVANGAPAGSGLVVSDVKGTLTLPPGADLEPDTADDPLALPQIEREGQVIVQPLTMNVRGVGPDGVPATADDVDALNPAEQGQAEFLVRGEKEGFHELNFAIEATLDGLPVGPVKVRGRAAGGVLVRNPFFDMTFTVPATTRRGERFKVFATVTNIGQGIANDVQVTLDGVTASGATLLGEGTQHIDTLRTGDAVTLAFEFRAERTGKVVASYLAFEPGVAASGQLKFALGVGERGVPLSPDTLVLPASIDLLPAEVSSAAMRVLGQAWSIANAPDGSLHAGVIRVSRKVATEKALALSEAGLRMTLGQAAADAVRDIAFDFYGGSPLDPGFDQLLRQTEAGHDLARALGAALAAPSAAAGGPIEYERTVSGIAASGTDFISFVVAGGGGGPPVDVAVVDAAGLRTVGEVAAGVPTSQVIGAATLPLGAAGNAPLFGLVTAPSKGPYTLELQGRMAGPLELAVSLPKGDGNVLRGSVSTVTAVGRRHRLRLADETGELLLDEDADGDGSFETHNPLATETLTPTGPTLVSATLVGPETLDSASPFGFQVAVLFDRPVDAESAGQKANYVVPRNGIQTAKRQLSGRLVFASLEQPEGPYIPSTVAVSGVADLRGVVGTAATVPLRSRLADPGAVVSGRVFKADGTPAAGALVTYINNAQWTCPEFNSNAQSGFASVQVGADGRYEFRFVRQDACGFPWRISTSDPESGAVRNVSGYVRAAGEQIVLDIALFGRGAVTGLVSTLGGQPVPGARVVAISVTDAQEGSAGVTDASGRYLLSGIPVGQVSISASKEASAGSTSVRLERAGSTAVADVTLDGGTVSLSGRVLKVEKNVTAPVPGAVVVYRLSSSGPLAVATTLADGTFSFAGLPVGSYVLSVALNARDTASRAGTAAAGDHLMGQDLVVSIPSDTVGTPTSLGTVRGTVRLPSGVPAGDVIVSIGNRGVLSAPDGTFEIKSVPVLPGVDQQVLGRSRDGLRSGSAVARIGQAGQIVEGITIALSGLGSVVFTVRDALGQPLAGQTVGLLNSCSAACGCSPKTTTADGTVRYDGLPIGAVLGKAVRSTIGFVDVADASALIMADGQVATATLRFAGTGSVSGTVTDPEGHPAFGAHVDLQSRVFDANSCGLGMTRSHAVRTDVNGRFQFANVGVGSIRVTASQEFYPTPVSHDGVIAAAGQALTANLVLSGGVSTISGELSGTVLQPDGVTPVGAGVEVTMNGVLPDVVVKTDAAGHYRFAKIFPEGRYTMTIRDAVTGALAQESIFLRAAVDSVHDVRLKGKGTVVVLVVNGAGQPVDRATVRLRELGFPNRLFEGVIEPASLGAVTFAGVFEGEFSVEASDAFARGGRASGVLALPGSSVDLRVNLTTTGTVRGHFYMPDGVTPIPLATISLVASGRTIGQTSTQGSGDLGAFSFDFVPAGPVQVSAQDPVTARTGSTGGTLASEGQVVVLDVIAQSLVTVQGVVTSNEIPEPGANVVVDAGSFHARTMTDSEGRYRITGVPEGRVVVTASLGDGFLAGTAAATGSGEGSVLSLDVALRGSGRVSGRVVEADGVTPSRLAVVSLTVGGTGGGSFSTTTAPDGSFAFDRVPSGLASFTARVLGSVDESRGTAIVPAGDTATVTVVLNGVGVVRGRALDSGGLPTSGAVRLTANGSVPFTSTVVTAADGEFMFPDVPAGPFTLSLTIQGTGFALYGTASGTLQPGADMALDVRAQASGTISGLVVRPDGATAAFGAAITVVLDANRGAFTLYADNDGRFQATGVPLGNFELRVRDQFTAGLGLVKGRRLDAGGQSLDVGNVVLDDTDVRFVSAQPPDGAVNVSTSQAIQVLFSDPLASASGVVVMNGPAVVPSVATLSADGLTVTLTGTWPDSKTLTVTATPAVTDVFGRRLVQSASSTFTTVDQSPPVVVAVVPGPSAIEVPANAQIVVSFNETLGAATNLVTLVTVTGPGGPVPGVTTVTAANVATFTPAAPLAGNTVFTVIVNGAVDLGGRTQLTPFQSVFTTVDTLPPVLTLLQPVPNAFTANPRPTILVGVADTLSGVDFASGSIAVDGIAIGAARSGDAIQAAPLGNLSEGQHTVVATIRDRAGNAGSVTQTFSVDRTVPSAALVAGVSAGQVIAGQVSLSGSADDAGSGVNQIQFLADGVVVASAGGPAFTTTYDTRSLTEGAHNLSARAIDAVGNVGANGPAVQVFVDNLPLSVTFSIPAPGTRARDSVVAGATSSEAVSRIEFSVDGMPAVADTTAPYEVNLSLMGVAEGPATITATAFAIAGGSAQATRQIVVDRTPPAMPDATKIFGEPPDGASSFVYGQPGAVEASATVRVTNTSTGAQVSTFASADGGFATNITAASGHVLSIVAVDAAGNASAPATTVVRDLSSLPAGPADLRFEGIAVDRVGAGAAALTPDGQLDAIFTLSFAFGSDATRQLAFVDLQGPTMRSTKPEVASVLGVGDELGAPLRNMPDGRVSFPITSSAKLTLFASSEGFIQAGATYRATAAFTNGSRYEGTLTIPQLPSNEAVGATLSVANVATPDLSGSDPKEVVGVPFSVTNVILPVDAGAADPKEAIGPVFSVNNPGLEAQRPLISSVRPGVIDATRPPAALTVTGANLAGATFSVLPAATPAQFTFGAPTIDPTGTAATVPFTILPTARGSFVVIATTPVGASDTTASAANSLVVISALDDVDSDGDGFPDGLERLYGSDPSSLASTPNLTARGTASGAVSVVNTVIPAGVTQHAGTAVSVVNTAVPAGVTKMAMSSVSVVNTVIPQGVSQVAVTNVSLFNTFISTPQTITGGGVSILNEPAAQSLSESAARTSALDAAGAASDPEIVLVGVVEADRLIEGQTRVVTANVSGDVSGPVTFTVNGVPMTVDATVPYEMTFTVPAGVRELTFGATLDTGGGEPLSAPAVRVEVDPDVAAVVTGRVVDGTGNPVAGALVEVISSGLRAEYFDSPVPLAALPDLAATTATRSGRVTALNMRSPGGVFGADPFGTGLGPDFSARFTGWLSLSIAGRYDITLGADEGARLKVAGATIVDMPTGVAAGFQESSGAVDLPAGLVPIEVTFYESTGNAQLQLSFTPPGGERQVVPPAVLVPRAEPLVATTGPDGRFAVRGVPTALENVTVVVTPPADAAVTVPVARVTPATELGEIQVR